MASQPPAEAIAAARASHIKHRIPASVGLAQWALESAWGRRMPPGSNNPFGIKARKGEPSVTVATREVIGGKSIIVQAAFRKFDSLQQAFDHHGRLLATAKVYAPARAVLPDPFAFAHALTGRYATDPKYGELIGSIIRASNLTRFDA